MSYQLKPGYLRFVDLRDRGALPKGVTWEIWQKMDLVTQARALKLLPAKEITDAKTGK